MNPNPALARNETQNDELNQEMLTLATDGELLMRFARHKDERCFETLVTRYSELVYRVCRTVLLNPTDAEDACQATFLILIRKANWLTNVGSLGAWLYKVAYRLSVRANLNNRKKSHSSLESEPESEIDQFHLISRKEILSGVYEELLCLPNKYQEVLVECYLQGKTYREVAELTDSTETIVKGRVAQAKKTLRRRLLKRGIALSFVLVMLEQVRSQAVGASLTPHAWTCSLQGLISEPSTKVSQAVSCLTNFGIRRMTMQLLTKPVSVFVFALVATCLPVFWVMNQPILGQEGGPALEVSATPQEKGTKIKTTPLDSRKLPQTDSQNKIDERKKSKKPRVQTIDPFDADPGSRKKTPSKRDPFSEVELDPFGVSPKRASNSPVSDPFGTPGSIQPKSKRDPRIKKDSRRTSGAAAESKIELALNTAADFDFVDTPLIEVADYLADFYHIAIEIDRQAIEDVGFSSDTPMTGSSKNRTLRSALRFLFEDAELTFLMKNETLIITTEEAISSRPSKYLISKLYDISSIAVSNPDSVVNTLQQGIDSSSWIDNGGYAAMNMLEVGEKTLLAVTHTSEHHVSIQNLLEQIQQMSAK